MKQVITWETLRDKFPKFKIENEGKKNPITSSRMTRMGLELSGFIRRKKSTACILFGNEEYKYLKRFSKDEINDKLSAIFKLNPPAVILSRSFPYEVIKDCAVKHQVAVFSSNSSSSEINTIVNIELLRLLSDKIMIHGNLVEVFGMGVLIIGDSGIGKSEITLELLKKGHIFISDDAVEYYRLFDRIMGKSNDITKNLIEIRGIGILNIAKLYGIQQIKNEIEISVIIEMSMLNDKTTFERLGREGSYKELAGINIPYYKLPISPGRNAADIIEVIVNKQKLIMNNEG